MITHIRVKNFKSWQDSGKVKLAPLTGFFGTNSSGKSSLLQMLLLLKQTAERSDANEFIFFGSENSLVNLGNFYEVIHGHKLNTALGLEIEWETSRLTSIPRLTFNTTIVEDEGVTLLKQFSYVASSVVSKDKGHLTPIMAGDDENIFINGEHIANQFLKNCYGVIPSKSWWEIHDQYNGPQSTDLLKKIPIAFEELFAHVYYFGPVRVQPQRHYHWRGVHPKEINFGGDKAIDALLSARVRQLKTSSKEDGVLIEERVSKWLQNMELAHSFSLVLKGALDDNNYEIRIQKTANSAEVTLADMGHGVGDLFPLLVHCCYVPEGSTLILEQPGVHLHPKTQSDLADLLIEIITERNLQILIESHSEHLLNRLQRRVAEEKISVDQTALYFCRNDKGVSNIERLEIDEFGNIANWPENFFGDEMGDLFAMTEAQRERQKRAGG